MEHVQLRAAYTDVRRACRNDWHSDAVSRAILDLAVISLQFLATECDEIALNSLVPRKNYISFSRNHIVTRPANRELFLLDPERVTRGWHAWMRNRPNIHDAERIFYTVALAPCLAMELFDRNNKKGPATFFECMIGHIFAKSLDVNPTKRAALSVPGRSVRMTMDFLFETADDSPNIHLPVKMSTRERVVQAWAHQRLLDAAHGRAQYRGIMVLFSETKLDSRTHEVVEICVPDQWLAYQTLLARMERIYYFDMPIRYKELTEAFPSVIQIRPFQELLTEIATVVGP